jgi:hypothetical protein
MMARRIIAASVDECGYKLALCALKFIRSSPSLARLIHPDDVGDRDLPVLHGLQDDEFSGLVVIVERDLLAEDGG